MDRPTEAELRQRIVAGSQESDDYGDLAQILAVNGQTEAAIDILERALALPLGRLGRAEILAGLGWLLYECTKQTDRARSLGDEGIALLAGEAETPPVLFARGAHQSLVAHCHWRSDEAAAPDAARAALATFERLLAEYPDWDQVEQAWIETGRLYTALQDPERAIPLCQRYLQANLESGSRLDGLLTLGEAYRLAGRFEEAEAAATEAVRLAAAHRDILHNAWHLLGLVQQAAGRPAEARRSFEQGLVALTGHPLLRDDADWRKCLHGRLAEVFGELGEHVQAASSWRELLNWYNDADPARARVLVCLGDACYRAGAFAEARAAYEAVLADPRASDEDQAEARVWAL